ASSTFIVIFVSSWRASRLNITAAIRDLPETRPINPEMATWRGYVRAALNGILALGVPVGLSLFLLGPIGFLLGVPLILIGLVAPWFYVLCGSNIAQPRELRTDEGPPKWPWILGLAIPVIGWLFILPWYFIALFLVRVVRERKPAGLPLWVGIAGIAIPPMGFIVALLQNPQARVSWSTGIAFAAAIAGGAMTYAGLDLDSAFFFFLGVSLLFLFAAVTLRYFGIAERLSFTVTSALLLLLWYLPSSVYEKVVGNLDGDIEMFFLSGMVMVTAAVFIVVYNADIILPAIAAAGSRFGRILPAIRTGVAYPLSARFRTGMTMIMIGLIMFSLVVMATMNTNFAAIFLNDETRGGYDVALSVNGNNLVDDFDQTMEQAGVDTSPITAHGELRIAYSFEAEVENRDQKEVDGEIPEFSRYPVVGADQGFLQSNAIEMKYLAKGYGSTAEVWAALANDPHLAVIPASLTAPPDPFGPPMGDLLKLDPIQDGFDPFTLRVRDPGTDQVTTVTVIGMMKESAEVFLALGQQFGSNAGLITGMSTVSETFPAARGQVFYLALADGTDAEDYAKQVEAGLVQVSAESLQKLLDEQQALQNGFLLVFQGFMGLGLIVGIAALAVVASRSVVERRQQIGMLRAIGYQRGMVALSFLFESGFIALSGIILGLTLGLSLAFVLFTSGEMGEESKGATFIVPWLNLAIVCAVAFGASMLMTFLPARQASRVPVAEALRYE
ncbi:MAG: FtsX-like permease family protein, partial [Dehalococcoidia bacterium]|nr:FtsX-like permease family protein [Dehalococcoidia bacterium]